MEPTTVARRKRNHAAAFRAEHLPEAPMKLLYLDRLPEDALRNVFRHMSARPKYPNWQAHVDSRDALHILRLGGPFAEIARSDLAGIGMAGFRGCTDIMSVQMAHPCDYYRFRDLINEIGMSIESLSLDCSQLLLSLGGFGVNRILDCRFFSHCISLTSLIVSDELGQFNLDVVLRVCKGRLRTLDIGGDVLPRKYISAIAENCSGLEHLAIRYDKCEAAFCRVWRAVGPTLRELIFSSPQIFFNDGRIIVEIMTLYTNLPAYCEKLSTLELRCDDFSTILDIDRFPIDMITGFGGRLKKLRFSGFERSPTATYLEKIIAACPNVAIDICISKNVPNTLRVLGGHLRALSIGDKTTGELEDAAKFCGNLEELTLWFWKGYPIAFLSSFFAFPKPKLRAMDFQYGHVTINDANNMFHALSSKLTTLEKFSCAVKMFASGVFRTFAEANKRLTSVHIVCTGIRHTSSSAEVVAAGMVRDFFVCPRMKTLMLMDKNIVGRSELIAEAAFPMRGKVPDVFIGGVQYYP